MSDITTSSVSPPPVPPTPIPFIVDDSLSSGSIFCIMFFLALFIYFGGGIAVRKLIRGAEGPEVIPHYHFWTDLPYLIKDGIIFTLNGFQPELTYERI